MIKNSKGPKIVPNRGSAPLTYNIATANRFQVTSQQNHALRDTALHALHIVPSSETHEI